MALCWTHIHTLPSFFRKISPIPKSSWIKPQSWIFCRRFTQPIIIAKNVFSLTFLFSMKRFSDTMLDLAGGVTAKFRLFHILRMWSTSSVYKQKVCSYWRIQNTVRKLQSSFRCTSLALRPVAAMLAKCSEMTLLYFSDRQTWAGTEKTQIRSRMVCSVCHSFSRNTLGN